HSQVDGSNGASGGFPHHLDTPWRHPSVAHRLTLRTHRSAMPAAPRSIAASGPGVLEGAGSGATMISPVRFASRTVVAKLPDAIAKLDPASAATLVRAISVPRVRSTATMKPLRSGT